MKRFCALFLSAALCFSHAMAEQGDKYSEMPPILVAEVLSEDREVENNQSYIHKEYLQTTNETVNAELRAIVDAYDKQLSPTLQPDPKSKGHRNSRLDIDTVYYRSGEQWISAMVMANAVWYQESQALEMTTRTYDLKSGNRLFLTDLFPADSAAWEILSHGVRAQLQSVYPGDARDQSAIAALCSNDSLAQAEFTLSGMELTLHYFASEFIPGKPNLVHVRFYYPQFKGMLTPLGAAVTDNSRWKMVAITCDDGPKDYNSTYALDAFRKVGARVTYFHVGTQLERYGHVFQRQFNQNHSFGSHSYHHWSGYSFKTLTGRLKELTLNDELTLALVGETAGFFRAPGGTYPPWIEAKLPVPIIQWSLDTYDYTGKIAKKIFYSVRNNVQEYDIILCHDTGKFLHAAVPLFGKHLNDHGYMMVTLEELAAAQGVSLEPNVVYWSFRPNENSIDRLKR